MGGVEDLLVDDVGALDDGVEVDDVEVEECWLTKLGWKKLRYID